MIGKTFSKALKKTTQIVTVCDLFSTTELLRYRQNPEFKSANGGLCSIAVIIAFAIIFTQTIFATVEKLSISSQITEYEETDPSYFSTLDSPFLFAIGLNGYNLNSPTVKYFNIEISQRATVNGVRSSASYQLIPCQRNDWVEYNLGESFDAIGLSSYLCLPSNTTFEFTGKYTSSIFKYMKISLKTCSILAGDARTCVNPSQIDANITNNGPISFNYYFVNTIINPDNSQYLGSYLEDRNYFQFTRQLGTSANIFISSYSIATDQSLWPWSDVNQESGGIVYENTQRYVYTPTLYNNSTEYISLYLRKSSLSLSITRSFKKYDDTLSYIGGLFSTFMVTLFVMMKYNEYNYEIEIASKIYKYKKGANIQANKFNLISYFGYSFYCVLDFFNIAPQWKIMKQFDDVREEIGKQLDLRLLIRKISFLEDCIGYIFEDYELECLHLKGKMTLEEAEAIRKRFSSRKKLLKLKKKFEVKQQIGMRQFNEQKSNKESIRVANNKVADVSILSNQSEMDDHRKASRLIYPQFEEEIVRLEAKAEEEEHSNSSEDEEEEKQKKLLIDYIESLNQLKEEAGRGNARCRKIYRNLDKAIKSLPNSIKQTEMNETKAQINYTEQRVEIAAGSSKKAIEIIHISQVGQ